MGSAQSKDKMYCTRYLNGHGPPSLTEQVEGPNGMSSLKIKKGNQPDGGHMTLARQIKNLEGYPDCDTIQINFEFADGIQTEAHPYPGQKYYGLQTSAFLPQNSEGRKVLKLLDVAFHHKVLFTVATTSTGEERVTFTDIPLKTSMSGGLDGEGYPDPSYLKTVTKILKSKGIK